MDINPQLLRDVLVLAKKAGQEILKIYDSNLPLEIKTKHDSSPVTLADILAHDIISNGLKVLTPGMPILSEEDPNYRVEIRQGWQSFWLIDPLDGTKEYIARSGQFTVNIALVLDCQPVLGVIYVPLKNKSYYGAQGLGSFMEDEKGSVKSLQVRHWNEGDEITLVTTRKELHIDIQEALAAYGPISIAYRSSSLKFCLLAEGGADIYLRKKPIHEWDTAAGQCILENAGGIVLDSNWNTLRYNTKSDLLNPPFIALGDSKQLLPILKLMPLFEEF